ncbi:FAS1-like dehydratase domain-containing protein [Kurthia sibirica]|nr:MaoC family dehydratase N-terminal domain-containing protein [Kurthia sibirica]GEK34328.1 hypothetical protein KSI01_18610 [Kurthia sibirica]
MLKKYLKQWSKPQRHTIQATLVEKLNGVLNLQTHTISPTLPIVFDYGTIAGLPLPLPGLIHGSQRIHYYKKLAIDDKVDCQYCVNSFELKEGKKGQIGLATLLYRGFDVHGDIIYEMESVLILSKMYMERNLKNDS